MTPGGSVLQWDHQAQRRKWLGNAEWLQAAWRTPVKSTILNLKQHQSPWLFSTAVGWDMERSETNPLGAVVWPKGLRSGEQTPLYVCTHGLGKGMHFHPALQLPEAVSSTGDCREGAKGSRPLFRPPPSQPSQCTGERHLCPWESYYTALKEKILQGQKHSWVILLLGTPHEPSPAH